MADIVPSDCRHVHLEGNPTTGACRNAGCQEAKGDVIAHFDDDDYSAPERLGRQMACLAANHAQVVGYHSMRFTDGTRWWRYSKFTHPEQYALGTSLCYRKDWWAKHRFPDARVGEDGAFVERARGVIVSTDAGDLMYATIHKGNTSPRQLNGCNWKEL